MTIPEWANKKIGFGVGLGYGHGYAHGYGYSHGGRPEAVLYYVFLNEGEGYGRFNEEDIV